MPVLLFIRCLVAHFFPSPLQEVQNTVIKELVELVTGSCEESYTEKPNKAAVALQTVTVAPRDLGPAIIEYWRGSFISDSKQNSVTHSIDEILLELRLINSLIQQDDVNYDITRHIEIFQQIMFDGETEEKLHKCLQKGDDNHFLEAVLTLVNIISNRVSSLNTSSSALRNSNQQLAFAARVLGIISFRRDDILSALKQLLDEKELEVRVQAALALANLGEEDAKMFEIFTEATASENKPLRRDAGRGIHLLATNNLLE